MTLPAALRRTIPANIKAHGELQTLRHFTRLSQLNYSIDTHFYPLGSCTMKYNPRIANKLASMPGFLQLHPYSTESQQQGLLACLYELQNALLKVTGMQAISLAPMAGAQGEFAGIAMIKAYHQSRSDHDRCEVLVPEAAHGTNPASAAMCGYQVKEIKITADGDVDIEHLQSQLSEKTAAIMLTNPSTLGVFERQIETIAQLTHQAGGLLYYDGANLNAVLGNYRPGDMGFDVMHLNCHKTFATPHGGGGPGAGPVACNARLQPYLPAPLVKKTAQGFTYQHLTDLPHSIGQLSAFHGNTGVLLRAYLYATLLGESGMKRVGQYATLNANYLCYHLQKIGYTAAYPLRRASHEFIITLKPLTQQYGVTAADIAKRILDYGFYAPTIYFPTMVPECLLIEPTETENKQELDRFLQAMQAIYQEIKQHPEQLKTAPHQQVIKRVNEVKAAKELMIAELE